MATAIQPLLAQPTLTQFLRYGTKHQRCLQWLRAEGRLRLRPGRPLDDHQILCLINHNHLAEDPQRPQGMLQGCLRSRLNVGRIHRHFVVPPLEAVNPVRMGRRHRASRPRPVGRLGYPIGRQDLFAVRQRPVMQNEFAEAPQSSSVALNPCAPTSCWPLA